MYAYKGFHKNLTCTMGKGTYQYEVNKWYEEKEANCVKNGFHCCENPLDCLTYYPLNGDNRFFLVEAAGDINESGTDKISCTKIRLLKELTPVDIAVHAARYMFRHPAKESEKKRKENYKKIREEHKTVWHGKCAGKLLADVLEADFLGLEEDITNESA